MYISKVSLVNYRNFRNAAFVFNKGVNTIIGENGSGKTNLFKAMRLLLDDSMVSYAYKLDDGDFNRSLGSWRGHWIILSIEFDELDSDEAIQSLFVHKSGVIESGSTVSKATYNLFYRPKLSIRTRLSELNPGDTDGLDKILTSINARDDYETFFTGKSTADFCDPEVYKVLVGDFEKVIFPNEMDTSLYGVKIHHQLSISKEISFTYIQALRDVVSDFHNNRTNPLLTLLKSKSGQINEKDFEPITDKIAELNDGIEQLRDVKDIRQDIHRTMKDAVGETYALSSLSIKSNLPDEADKLLQSLKLFIGEPGEQYEGAIHELSLGGANLIFLTLKLLEYHYAKAKDTFANFLVIEEPEAHIHTHVQKTLFDNVRFDDTQIIYSTHSTYISEVCNVKNMNILVRRQDYAEVYQPSTGLDDPELNKVQRYLDSVRSNVLFAKGVLLVEGDAEEILIPYLFKKVFGLSLDELGISLINIRSTGFTNLAQLFHPDRIRRKCAIITDLDQPVMDTDIKPDDRPAFIAFKNKIKKAAELGVGRKVKLEAFQKSNDWIKTFFAEYTFEVDFVKADNASEVEKTIDSIYTKAETIELARKQINSGEVTFYGTRVLRMADEAGKGWFAILLSKAVTSKTYIPKYIIDAILFVKSEYSNSLLHDILLYRIEEHRKVAGESEHIKRKTTIDKLMMAGDFKNAKDYFIKELPDDSIVYFLNQLA